MHQTRKGQQWYFGMKIHIGVDSQSGLVHSAVVTSANVHDKQSAARPSARQRAPRLWRQCIREPEGADSRQGTERAGLHQPAHMQGGVRSRRGEEGEEPQQVEDSLAGRARLCGGQAAVGRRQGSLPRVGEERAPRLRDAGAGQHLSRAPTTVGTSPCMTHGKRANGSPQGSERAN